MFKLYFFVFLITISCGFLKAKEPFLYHNGVVNIPQAYLISDDLNKLVINYNTSTWTFFNDKKGNDLWLKNFNENMSNLSASILLNERLEVSFLSIVNKFAYRNFGAGFKYLVLMPSETQKASMSFGAGLFSDLIASDENMNYLYIVFSQEVFDNMDFSLGYSFGDPYQQRRQDKLFMEGLLLGIKLGLSDKINIMADFDGRGLNAGFTYKIVDTFAFNFAIGEIENNFIKERDANANKSRLSFGISWILD